MHDLKSETETLPRFAIPLLALILILFAIRNLPWHLDDYDHAHPTTALLVVEVADSSLAHDKNRKIPSTPTRGFPRSGC